MELPLGDGSWTIRMMRAADAAAFARYRDDPEVARLQGWSLPYTLADAAALIDGQAEMNGPTRGDWVQLALEVGGALAGDVAVGLDDDGTVAMIGYTLDRRFQGRGLATAAVRAVIDALWADGVDRIEAGVDPTNGPSIALLTRLGFRCVSVTKRALKVRGEWVDDALYVLDRP